MDLDEIREYAKKYGPSYKRDLEEIIARESEALVNIQSMDALKNVQSFWEKNKIAIDALASQLSRINEGVQHVTVDVEQLKLPTHITDDLLLSLNSSGILDYFQEKNPVVVTSEPIREFLKGQDIIVKDAQRLNAIQEKVSDLIASSNKAVEAMAATMKPMQEMVKPRETIMIPHLESENVRNFNNQAQEDRRNRALMKHNRILADNTPPKQHILETILEHYVVDNKGDTGSISIDYYHFNFEDSGFGKRKIEMYLDEIIGDGLISKYTWHPNQIRSRYIFDGVDRDGIEKALRDDVDEIDRVKAVKERTIVIQGSGDVGELLFDPSDGNTSLMGAKKRYNFGTKYRVFLTLLFENPGMPFGVKDFQKYGNSLLKDQGNLFRGDGDINRVYNQIKQDLKASKGIPFPIERKKSESGDKQWVWPRK